MELQPADNELVPSQLCFTNALGRATEPEGSANPRSDIHLKIKMASLEKAEIWMQVVNGTRCVGVLFGSFLDEWIFQKKLWDSTTEIKKEVFI